MAKENKPKATTVQATPRKSSRISEVAAKRKATEDVSPSSLKKRKAVTIEEPAKKKTTKPAEKAAPAKKSKKTAARNEVEEDKENDTEEPTSKVDAEDDATTKALVQELDDEDDEAAGGVSLFQPGQDVGKAPPAAVKKAAQVKGAKSAKSAKSEKGAKGAKDTSKTVEVANGTESTALVPAAAAEEPAYGGVVYVGRIPHGFFEHEMRSYFGQFGDIRRLRLSRNRKTGASKHYAFIEFVDRDVADIVAKTMDNYLLFGHILRCSVVSQERIPPNLFKGANRRFKAVPWNFMAGRRLAQPQPEDSWVGKISREEKRRAERAAQLESTLGYSFKGPELKTVDTVEAPVAAIEDKKKRTKKAKKDTVEEKVEEKLVEAAPAKDDAAAAVTEAAPEAEAVPVAAKGKKAKGKKAKA